MTGFRKGWDENGLYPIYGSGGLMGYANDYLCEPGTTIIGRKGSINNPLYVDEKFWNVDTAFGLVPTTRLYFNPFCGVSLSVLLSQLKVTSPSLIVVERFVGTLGRVFGVILLLRYILDIGRLPVIPVSKMSRSPSLS